MDLRSTVKIMNLSDLTLLQLPHKLPWFHSARQPHKQANRIYVPSSYAFPIPVTNIVLFPLYSPLTHTFLVIIFCLNKNI